MDNITINLQTDILYENYKLVWNLYNFDRIPFLTELPIYGPKFSLGASKWYIMVSKETIDGQESIGFKLLKENKRANWEFVKFTIVLNSKGLSVTCMQDIVSYGYIDNPFTYIKERDLSVEDREILRSVDLAVECTFQYVHTKEEDEIVEPNSTKHIFVEDMKGLHNNGSFCDITLIAKDGTEFACHRSILCTRSMRFNGECQSLGKNSYLHLDLDKRTAKALIWYIYTGQMPHKFNEDDYKKLYIAAEYYSIPHLEKLCLYFLNAKGKISCICPKCKNDADTEDELTDEDDE